MFTSTFFLLDPNYEKGSKDNPENTISNRLIENKGNRNEELNGAMDDNYCKKK